MVNWEGAVKKDLVGEGKAVWVVVRVGREGVKQGVVVGKSWLEKGVGIGVGAVTGAVVEVVQVMED